jgi:hypothetical protein
MAPRIVLVRTGWMDRYDGSEGETGPIGGAWQLFGVDEWVLDRGDAIGVTVLVFTVLAIEFRQFLMDSLQALLLFVFISCRDCSKLTALVAELRSMIRTTASVSRTEKTPRVESRAARSKFLG